MNEQIQVQKPQQCRTIGPIISMIAGIIFLAASIFIRATGVGSDHGLGSYYHTLPGGGFESIVPGPLVALDTLSIPSIPIGVTLFLIGLVNTTKKPSLRWLRIAVNILCGILLGLAVLVFVLLSLFLIIMAQEI